MLKKIMIILYYFFSKPMKKRDKCFMYSLYIFLFGIVIESIWTIYAGVALSFGFATLIRVGLND